jgi:hypothetical protein
MIMAAMMMSCRARVISTARGVLPRPLDGRSGPTRSSPLRRRHGAGTVAIGMQSFIGTDIGRIRRLIGLDEA